MNTYTYHDMPVASAYQPTEALQIPYRGLTITKEREFNLYSVEAPFGKTIHPSLTGLFTTVDVVKAQIDKFIEAHGSIDTAFTDTETKPRGPGRPSYSELKEKEKTIAELTSALTSLQERMKEISAV